MKTEHKNVRSIRTAVVIILGNALYALTVKVFLLPGNLMVGGTTGIGLLIHRFTGMSLSGFVLLFNLVMLAAGFLLLGKKFALTTVISSLAYPVLLEVFDAVFGNMAVTEDIILNTVFSGLGIGVSLGLVIRMGASTGGMDIPPLVLNKYFRIPVSVSLNVFDMLILLGQAVLNPPERILYGIILVFIYTSVLDKVIMMGTTRTEVKVVSKHVEEIRYAILAQVDRGVTLLYGEGGYLQEETRIVLSILSNRELPKVERLIRDIDPEAFMIVSRVTEVRGKGFSISKDYIKKQKN
ncbi:MAG: YitT family protein [Dorea sp.]|nr:YitT family protein [Dorea sp.]